MTGKNKGRSMWGCKGMEFERGKGRERYTRSSDVGAAAGEESSARRVWPGSREGRIECLWSVQGDFACRRDSNKLSWGFV